MKRMDRYQNYRMDDKSITQVLKINIVYCYLCLLLILVNSTLLPHKEHHNHYVPKSQL